MIKWPCGCYGISLKEYTDNGCGEHGKAPQPRLNQIVKELFEIVDSVECSDNNRYFHPTELQFSSCRVMAGQRIGAILDEMKQLVGAKPRMSEEEMHLLNNPTDCGER